MIKIFLNNGEDVVFEAGEEKERKILIAFLDGKKGNIKVEDKSYITDDINNIMMFPRRLPKRTMETVAHETLKKMEALAEEAFKELKVGNKKKYDEIRANIDRVASDGKKEIISMTSEMMKSLR